MKDDMTYNEIDQIKQYIHQFMSRLQEFAQENNMILKKIDIDFFTFISKHIILFRFIYQNNDIGRFYKVLISDCYYLLISIIKGETRYMYVNERSIIENYLRLIANKSVEKEHVTEKVFQELRQLTFKFEFTDGDFSLIKNEYVISCGYIHASQIIDNDLSSVFCECIKNEEFKDRSKYYIRMQKVFKIFDCMLMSVYTEDISGAFHRRKTLLEYLIGKGCLEILFAV